MVYEAAVPKAVLGSNVEFVAENGERSLLYHRPTQHVGREIWKFKKVN
jgi:hypothetical protein